MKKMELVIGIGLAALLAIGGIAMSSQQAKHTGSIQVKNDDEAGFAGMAKISLDSAVNAALKAVPGKVLKTELENENGYLVYGIDIAKADRQIADVKVDAGNGKVLNIEADQKDKDKDKESHEGEDSDNGHEEVGER